MKILCFVLLCFIFIQIQFKPINGGSILDLTAAKIGDFAAEEEDLMQSESSRRILAMQKKYISYETLKRDLVPCGTPGASYYNCKASGEANPYNRGCEVITRCARDVRDVRDVKS